jgi:hypothetical protein
MFVSFSVIVVTYTTIIHLSFTTSGINMATLHTSAPKKSSIQFFIGLRGVEIRWRLLAQQSMYKQTDMFKTSQRSVNNEEWSGCPSTSTTKGNAEHVCTTTDEAVNRLLICHSSAYKIIPPLHKASLP